MVALLPGRYGHEKDPGSNGSGLVFGGPWRSGRDDHLSATRSHGQLRRFALLIIGRSVMKNFFGLMLALALSAGLATLLTTHPTEALPMGTGYWSASY
jgi:hypothetical protein